MSFAGRMSKMKTRDLVARLNELQCVYVGQEGSHCKYKTPCGQSITFRCIKMNEELSLNVYSSVRRVLRAEGLDIDGSGYQPATCGDFVGAHRHVAGLSGDVIPFSRRLTKAQSEKRYIHDREEWFQAVTTPGSAVWAIFQTGPKVAAVVHEPATVRPDGRLSDYLTVRLEHGELHSVPTQTVAVRQTTEGRLLQFPGGGGDGGLRGLPSGWVLPPGLAGLGAGSDADYYGEARMALDEEEQYRRQRWAQMTPAEHRAEAKGARQMAEAMARSAMRAADGKTARYLQTRVVFYNQQAAEHERAALRKQRADEA